MDWQYGVLDYHAWRIENFSRHLLTLPEAVYPSSLSTPAKKMSLAEALLQLIDHQAYHLGQVTYSLRHLGVEVSKGTTFLPT
jgi:uncharacterized damage-inducible protein DinB